MESKKILPFNYMKGTEFTKQLKRVTGCVDFHELSSLLNIPKATFSTWNTHERTSHELIIRLHLALGVPIEELALEPKDRKSNQIAEPSAPYMSRLEQKEHIEPQATLNQHAVAVVPSFCLTNGQLIETGEIPYSLRIFNSWNLDQTSTIEIETNDGRYLVDKRFNDAMSGEYLIDMNGRMSLNHIQRLPHKLAVVFGNSTVELQEEDIKVIGRVVVTLKKD
ncbi:chromosome partitioning protein ParA [Vibrio cidicii]|uniref:phage repressor protein CI n=1 Tax=Vibrio cidicii TaxID=1763883 RepID=UPI0018C2E0B7|nr:phage repressor protein CI [Vibrio cidicii]MBG0760909.1 chromosome partitioning protein ParA [Vibrio cidicii]